MIERPILFSADMVHAIMAGRKSQTRRVVKPRELKFLGVSRGGLLSRFFPGKCPYGAVGDRLWVKETFQPVQLASAVTAWRYRATDLKGLAPWKPSIFMPRSASRITLEIVSVHVERLNDISNEDCFAEGLPWDTSKGNRTWYADLWESINGKGSWDENPWVWVIEFRRIN